MCLPLYALAERRFFLQAVHGNFSGTKQQEIVVIRGKILELLRPDTNTGKVHTVLSVEAFGEVRSIVPFRLTGGNKGTVCVERYSILNWSYLCGSIVYVKYCVV